ncbi:MAG: N-acetyltransferase family protein [Vicinamibacterales bacterium]
MTVTRLDPADRDRLSPLIEAYAFKPYRNYRVLSRKAQDAVLAAEIGQTLEHDDGLVFHATEGEAAVAIVYRRLDWDSQFFGVPMGRIEYLLTTTPAPRALVDQVLTELVEACREAGVWHLTARADVADLFAVGLLESHGFRMMDSLVTYVTRPGKEPPRDVREVGAIRPFRPEDGPAIIEIAREAYQGFRGRFHLDPNIPDTRSDELYVEWARQCIGSRMADMVLVSEGAEGRVLGFLAFRRREPVSTVGGRAVFGGGLGACRRDTPGAYAGLIHAGTVWAHAHDGVAECQTQNYNFPTVRIYEAVGARYVRADYTLHAWLGPAHDLW